MGCSSSSQAVDVATAKIKVESTKMKEQAAAAVVKHTGKSHEEWIAQAKGKVVDYKSQIAQQLEAAISSSDNSRINDILDSAMASSMLKGSTGAIKNAAESVATRQLKDAIASEDPKQLKGALVGARRLCATEVPEFQMAVQKYKAVRKLPPGWDVAKMALHREGNRMVAKMAVEDEKVKAKFQRLLDLTHRKVYTRDRLGQPVPEKLELVSVSTVTNDDSWGDYMMRREIIKNDIESDCTDFVEYAVDTMATSNPEGDVGENLASIANTLAEDFAEPLVSAVNEVFLFHGTSRDAADKITTGDFKINLAGSHAGTLYGRGVYMAENSTKSDEYTRPQQDGTRYILICRTTLGRVFHTAEVTPDPRACEDACIRGKHHSVLGDRKAARGTFREFIMFNEEQIYPNYILGYRRREAIETGVIQGKKLIEIECPAGVSPGTTLQVQAPDGTMLQVLIPPGTMPGQKFMAQY